MVSQKLGKAQEGEPDVMIQKFQESIYKSENIEKQVEAFSKTIAHLMDRIDKTQVDHVGLFTNVKVFMENVAAQFTIVGEQVKSHTECIKEMSARHENLVKEKDGLGNRIEQALDKLEDAMEEIKKLPSMSSFIEISSEFKKIKDLFSDHAFNQLDINDDISRSLDKLKVKQDSLMLDVSYIIDDIKNIKINSDSNKKLIEAYSKKINEDLNFTLVNIKKTIEEKIASLPKPQILNEDDVKKLIEEKFEPTRLDASNAKLRSSNTDAKLVVLEKKIEQLQLLLNQAQINKG